jgi:lysophospholipase L1-like esterase
MDMKRYLVRGSAWMLAGLFIVGGCGPRPAERIVFMGDSITDGDTLQILVFLAIADSRRPTPFPCVPRAGDPQAARAVDEMLEAMWHPLPILINAGVAGDTAAGMAERLERDVLVHKPTLLVLSVGINDVLRQVPTADYERDVTRIAERMKAARIPMLIMTTSILGEKNAEADAKLAEYNASLRRVAEKYGGRVAEVNALMQKARAAGTNVLEADDVHLSFAGYRVMARAVLDALGYKSVPVPKENQFNRAVGLMPGVIRHWKVRAVTGPLDEAAVAALTVDETWKDLSLPQREPAAQWWPEQERKRGFAQGLDKVAGPSSRYVGVATLRKKGARKVHFNTGAQLERIWLNGKCLYDRKGEWTGWHAGRDCIPAELRPGANTVVIETGNEFFLSVTDDNNW